VPALLCRWYLAAFGVSSFERSMLDFAGIKLSMQGDKSLVDPCSSREIPMQQLIEVQRQISGGERAVW
jgi:hypothetical protein